MFVPYLPVCLSVLNNILTKTIVLLRNIYCDNFSLIGAHSQLNVIYKIKKNFQSPMADFSYVRAVSAGYLRHFHRENKIAKVSNA